MRTKRKRFESLIFEKLKDFEQFDRIRHNMLTIYDILTNRHTFFASLRLDKQFSLVTTVSSIATSTVRQHMNENMPISKHDPTKEFPLSQDWLFQEPSKIDI